MTLDVAWTTRWILLTREAVAADREYPIGLDRQVGNDDHSENLDRGFSQVISVLGERSCGSVQNVLKVATKTLMSTVREAAGPLYSTTFLRAAKACAPEPVNAEGVAALILVVLEGTQVRGKTEHGKRTMVSVWGPASDATARTASEGAGEIAVLKAAAAAAAEGTAATKPMRVTRGRASYLSEHSTGHLDPGAMSSSIVLAKALEATKGI